MEICILPARGLPKPRVMQSAARAAKEYIETHNRNQCMRRAYKYELRKAAEDADTARQQAQAAEKKAKKAEERARLAEERLQHTLQKEAGKGEQNTGQ